MSYDMIDRFLRNNLGDDDYAEYSDALNALCTPQRKPLTLGQKQRLWSSVGDRPTLKDRVNEHKLPSIECLEVAAAELRRLHEANQAMLHGLKAIKERLETSPTYVMLASEVFDSFYQQIIDEAIAKGEKS